MANGNNTDRLPETPGPLNFEKLEACIKRHQNNPKEVAWMLDQAAALIRNNSNGSEHAKAVAGDLAELGQAFQSM